ncbi:C-C motif chemokine 4-like [Cololabis saira]|uniref:C-C motif chemokine 4-like n=1 Tax=Cololabis saira TaxID=129043 RepID=UPI002AD4A6EA|nr:C-C motif chemokine 4-like [Cololabis saira]
MAAEKLFFCLLFITCCSTVTLAQRALDCCLSVSNKSLHKSRVVDYYPQSKGCNIDATILVTRNNKKICARPDDPWVSGVTRHVDKLRKQCKKNSKGKRCVGVNPRVK